MVRSFFFFLVRADPPLFACMCAREREQDALYDLSKGNYEIGFNRGVHFTLPFSFYFFPSATWQTMSVATDMVLR